MSVDVAAFHREAVRTPSHEDVSGMRDLVAETLAGAGRTAETGPAGTVVASRGTGRPHVVLNTHLDTVPPHVPYERDGDLVYGRGACDAKGPLAAFLAAFLDADVDGRLTLALSHDEETTQTGGARLAETLDPDWVVVGEPTGLDVCPAARGQFEGRIRIEGESAHAADPASGQSAVRAAAVAIQALETYDETRGPGEHDLLGGPTLTATGIEGGEATNQVPAECTITFDRRSVPPETATEFVADLEDHLSGLLPDEVGLSVSLARPEMPHPEAFRTDEDSPLVAALQRAGAGAVRPFGAATEASYFARRAPTVVFGPGVLADGTGPVAHADREYVRLSELKAAARTLRGALESL